MSHPFVAMHAQLSPSVGGGITRETRPATARLQADEALAKHITLMHMTVRKGDYNYWLADKPCTFAVYAFQLVCASLPPTVIVTLATIMLVHRRITGLHVKRHCMQQHCFVRAQHSVLFLALWRCADLFDVCSFVHHTWFHAVHRLIEQQRRPGGRLGKDTAANVEAAVATLQKEAKQLREAGEASFEVHYEPMVDGSFVASIVVRS